MRIGVLTSSRADFGIYLPLLKVLQKDSCFQVKIIAFGTHLSMFHGYTKDDILANGLQVDYEIESMMISDTLNGISSSLALTTLKFADFWANHREEFDLVFCLGDRYEMFAAVISGVPYQIKFAHIHGGETSLGAIDNIFRHSITLASKIHFVSTEKYKDRVCELLDSKENIFVTGALSLDNINDITLFDIPAFEDLYGINLLKNTVLVTFHPETVAYQKNRTYIKELIGTICYNKNYQFLITMPNADTNGNMIRNELIFQLGSAENVWIVENLGTKGYFTAMKYCSFLMGNTSSGIIEAASFGKYVINLGDRQKGREAGKNVFHVKIQQNEIQKAIRQIEKIIEVIVHNLYYNGGAAQKVVNTLKQMK
jgi:GDP/UDP-N,N'-diacetylbacillosamine 2-epimerase (hydrolysing)